jgi:hypothetical protein
MPSRIFRASKTGFSTAFPEEVRPLGNWFPKALKEVIGHRSGVLTASDYFHRQRRFFVTLGAR